MNIAVKLYLLLLLLTATVSCNGQSRTHLPKDNAGTPQTISVGQPKLVKTQGTTKYANVHCGLQDKAGNMWFGTTGEGVYRYDGKSFTNFTDKDGLANNNVYCVVEDKIGNLWFGTDAGLCRYDGKSFATIPITVNNSSNLYPLIGKNPSSSQPTIWSIFQDSKGTLWIGTHKDGIYCYDGTSFIHFLHNNDVVNKGGLRIHAANSIVEDKNGHIWFASWFDGVCRYDGTSITNFKPNDEVWFATILEDKKGNIWAGRRFNGVCMYDGRTFTNIMQGGIFDSCSVRPLIEDKKGNIWFGTEFGDMTRRESLGGLWRYDGKSFKNFTTEDGLSNNSVWCAVEDRDGNIWVGTRGMGLCRYNGKTFTNFSE